MNEAISPTVEFYRYRYLMGAMLRQHLLATVRLWCIPSELGRVEAIGQAWSAASSRMTQLVQSEAGAADSIVVADPPVTVKGRLEQIASDPLFRASFSALPASFKVVEIDRLVAPQREVNLDYVDEITARIPGPGVEDLLEFCVGPRSAPPEWKVLQTAQNQLLVTSKSIDLRFLGGFRKPITEDDVAVAHTGGQPVEAVTLLIGYGAASINVFSVGNRMILNNGFHRVFALRSKGITRMPVVVQSVAQSDIEFPNELLGLSREYLVHNPRPVLLRDFFDDSLTVELRLAPRRKTVKIGWGGEIGRA